jgi:hypothetical protein
MHHVDLIDKGLWSFHRYVAGTLLFKDGKYGTERPFLFSRVPFQRLKAATELRVIQTGGA